MITKQLQDEADRTIAGITGYYDQFGDSLIDAEEREHRISKVVAALEGCNGLTEKEKLQKTAENLFGLTCAWERDSLALKRELMLTRETTEKEFKKTQEENAAEFKKLGMEMNAVTKKIDTLGSELKKIVSGYYPAPYVASYPAITDGSIKHDGKTPKESWYHKAFCLLDKHFGTFVSFALIFILLIILSGNLEWLGSLFQNTPVK